MNPPGGSAQQAESPPPHGPLFWVTSVAGAAVVLFGLYGLLHNLAASQRGDFATWFIGLDLAHDLIVALSASLIGYLVTRTVRRPYRFPLQTGLFATAVVLAIGWAPLRGYGRTKTPDNPSVAPLNYTTAIGTVLVVVWTIIATWMIVAALQQRSHPATSTTRQPVHPKAEQEPN